MIRLADLITEFEPALRQKYGQRLLPSHLNALAALKACRSRFAPQMLATCTGCQAHKLLPHSCGHRSCPHCQHHDSQLWLQRQLKAWVPATYFVVTFTLPAQLRHLTWSHQRLVYDLMMQAAWATLNAFAHADKALGGTPGALAVLHTHNRQLGFHPHVHVCMPAAAFDAQAMLWRTKVKLGKTPGSRKPARGGFLFSHTALARVFAGKLQAALRAAGLTLPADLPQQWVVDCKAVGDGQQALKYLGRYLYRGVISERDLLRCKDGQLTYRWRDAKSGKSATRTVPAEDFLWLLLQHVLPKGLQRARNFGVLHHNARRTLALVQLTQAAPKLIDATPPTRPFWRCACGQPMVIVRRRMRPPSSTTPQSCAAPQTVQPYKAHPMETQTN